MLSCYHECTLISVAHPMHAHTYPIHHPPPPSHTGDETSGRIPVVYVEGDRPAQLLPYKMHLERHRVLRTKCMIHSMTYSTPEMGRLRTHVLTGLTPSTQVVGLVEQALAQLQVCTGRGMDGVVWDVFQWRSL